jgi:VIT1/CCC1 family predicted Fe2+/Mn2+ transporter
VPQTPHVEKHFTASATVRDIVIGMSDGLTVPFALAAGLSGAVDSTRVVITAGLAEIAAGSIAMGRGGYLAARTDAEHYAAELARERRETFEIPEEETREVADLLEEYGLPHGASVQAAHALSQDRKRWVDFMMKFELGLDKPDPARGRTSALTIAASYVGGGLIPLSPYFFFHGNHTALLASIAVTLIALFLFGWIKGHFTVKRPFRSALQTLIVGGLAAGAAYAIAKMIS